jgi:hypothetical protein
MVNSRSDDKPSPASSPDIKGLHQKAHWLLSAEFSLVEYR